MRTPVAVVAFVCSLHAGSLAAAAEVSFYCPFDEALSAQHAAGAAHGVAKRALFAEGRFGSALLVGPKDSPICYVETDNIDKARGSIELWVQPRWDTGDTAWRALIREEAPDAPGGNALWLWKYGASLRFDVRDAGDHLISAPLGNWPKGEWRHVVATWDSSAGTRLYVDGRRVAGRDFTFVPRAYGRFFVGNRGRGDQPAHAALDELRIYTRPLTDDEVQAAYRGTLARTRKLPVARPRPRSEARSAKLIFHLPFEQGCTAAVAGGDPEPLAAKGVELVPGALGKAGRFRSESRLQFREAGNLVKEQGTIMLWYRPDWSGDQGRDPQGRERRRCLFREGPAKNPRHGSNMMWLWCWATRLRFDLSDHHDRYVTQPINEWRAGEWHHIAVAWDCTRLRRFYVDGRRVRSGRDSRKPFLPMKWTPAALEHFSIGSDGRSTTAEGAIDELRIFDAPLTDDQITADYGRVFPVEPDAKRVYFLTGQPARVRWTMVNRRPAAARGRLSWHICDPLGKRLLGRKDVPLSMDPSGLKECTADLTPSAPGKYDLVCRWEPANGQAYERRLTFWGIEPESERAAGGEMKLKLVQEIDCSADLPDTVLAESGATRVVRSKIGAYREAGAKQRSRFALRVRAPALGRPCVIDWEYPDDKPRTMELIAQTVKGSGSEYELQTGAFCGAEYALSNRMMTQRSIFWPRGADLMLIFMTAEEGRPAAAARVRVYEVEGRLPKLTVRPAAAVNGWPRMVGLYYEDPALCYDFGGYDAMPDFGLTIGRLMDYMDYFGQNLFMYPAVWYHGPFYPSESQGVVMQRPHPRNYIEYMLLRFGQRGMSFVPTLNVHGLPSVADWIWDESMLTTGEAAAGPLTMLWHGAPNISGWHGTPPNYNPLHPDVRAAILNMVDEMLALYGESPAFKGLCFHLTKHCMLWFGTIEAGYNDYCVEAFERDTGIRVPVDPRDPGRSNARYRWLLENAREKWIEWRCRALHGLYTEVAAKLRSKRPDLKLVLALYRPNKRDLMLGVDLDQRPDYVAETNRESGADPALYRGQPNIVVQRTIYPADYRWYRSRRGYQDDPIQIRHLNERRASFAVLRKGAEPWVNMHDRYWEDAVGRAAKWRPFGAREMGWRVSTLNPNQAHCLDSYTTPLAQADAFAFTKGGFLVGTIGMEPQVGRFTQAFRAIPAKPFVDHKADTDPVRVRYCPDTRGLYVYAVNPSCDAQSVRLRFTGRGLAARDLVTDRPASLQADALTLRIDAYGLRAFLVRGEGVGLRE